MKRNFIAFLLLSFPLWIIAQEETIETSVAGNEMNTAAYEYQIVTSVESIVPNGIGRSRIIAGAPEVDYADFTTSRENGQKNKTKRSEIRVEEFEETKLLNFYNIGGIRFENIASNDAVVSSKINTLSSQGWELAFVSSAVESDAGEKDGQGIFITRYIFKRKIN
jgi:hypothetical protein